MSEGDIVLTYIEKILEYCDQVINDKLPNRKACKFEKLACKRHLSDLAKQDDPDFPFYFNEQSAIKRCGFTECLQHTKGKWRGEFIVLEPHQVFAQGVMFGWLKKKNNMRRFNRGFIIVPRKNGKSIDAATTGLYMAFADNEQGAEVYAGATTEAQAMMVFEPAFQMVKMNPDFAEYYKVQLTGTPKNPTSVYAPEDMSRFLPIVGKPGDGASPHAALVDEYHEHPTSVLYDAMDTGMGAREQPLLLVITTAGTNTASPCYELYVEATKVLEGTIENESLFCMIFTIDEDDDWQDFECWKKANPNYGISINEDYLRGKYLDALNNLSQRNIILTKHLNKWMNAGVAWMDMQKWNKGKDESLCIEDFAGCECWLSLDLASKIDLAALVMLFRFTKEVINVNCPKCHSSVVVENGNNVCTGDSNPEEPCGWVKPVNRDCVVAFARHYIPEETANQKENKHYQSWGAQGHLIITDGARTDFQRIEDDIKALSKFVVIKELAFDPKEASYLIQNIEGWSSFECIEFPQGPNLISEPMKELEAMVYANEFWHNGDPVFTWCIGNIVKKQSRSGGNVKHYFPTKEIASNKIDSGVAAIMALGRLKTYDYDSESVYNRRVSKGEERILRVI